MDAKSELYFPLPQPLTFMEEGDQEERKFAGLICCQLTYPRTTEGAG